MQQDKCAGTKRGSELIGDVMMDRGRMQQHDPPPQVHHLYEGQVRGTRWPLDGHSHTGKESFSHLGSSEPENHPTG